MGRYEAKPRAGFFRRKAKAVAAAVAAFVLGEVVLILSDTDVLAAAREVVPAPLQPFVPVLAAGIIYAVTHQVRNAPPSEQ